MENRPTKKIKLSHYDVDVLEFITWGEKEQIQNCLIKGANVNQDGLNSFDPSVLLEVKYKTFEICVKKITDEAGAEIVFSREWINNLSPEDGDALYKEIDTLAKKK
jgi:hypothetical protein